MKTVEINGIKYEVIENVDNCLNVSELEEKITDYFDSYDYIFGYNSSDNKKATKINNIKGLDKYKEMYCSYGAKTFLLKKIK